MIFDNARSLIFLLSVETSLAEIRVEVILSLDKVNLLLSNPKHLLSLLNGLFTRGYLLELRWLDMLWLEKSDFLSCLEFFSSLYWGWRIFRLLLLLKVEHTRNSAFLWSSFLIHLHWEHYVGWCNGAGGTNEMRMLKLWLSDVRVIELVVKNTLW